MAGVLQWVTVGEVKVLDVNCHECREAFAIDEYLLEFYFECQIICPTCARKKFKTALDSGNLRDIPNQQGV